MNIVFRPSCRRTNTFSLKATVDLGSLKHDDSVHYFRSFIIFTDDNPIFFFYSVKNKMNNINIQFHFYYYLMIDFFFFLHSW